MPAADKRIAGRVLLDTNILIYATLTDDPRFARAQEILLDGDAGMERFISVQNLAEMYPNLTGPKMSRPDRPATARAKIDSIARLEGLNVLPLTAAVQCKALELCENHGIARQKYFDAQLVATMLEYGITLLLTENVADFRDLSEISVMNPFKEGL
jgi:predicted nucleic acid-binding protein